MLWGISRSQSLPLSSIYVYGGSAAVVTYQRSVHEPIEVRDSPVEDQFCGGNEDYQGAGTSLCFQISPQLRFMWPSET